MPSGVEPARALAAAPPDTGFGTLRIGTLNTKMLPFTGTGERADSIAARILAGDYGIVILQEVFSETARDRFRRALAPSYPWGVDRLGSRGLLKADAGLMLFSRLPLEPIPDPVPFHAARLEARLSGNRTDEAPIRFLEFDSCARNDCWAGKGVAYARVRHAGRPLHLLFTHMQASYGSDPPEGEIETAEVRSRQRREIARFARAVVGADGLAEGNVLLVGDLNADGSVELTGGIDPRTRIVGNERPLMMEELGAPFPAGLLDLWRSERPDDPGLTFPVRELAVRFDYVLASLRDPAAPLCVTDIRLAYGLDRRRGPSAVDRRVERLLTDHVGLLVDLAPAGPDGCPAVADE